MSAATVRLARKLTLTLPALAFHAEGKHLLRYYAGPDRVLPAEPGLECWSLPGQIVVEHRLAQLTLRRVGHIEKLGPAVYGHGEFLTRQMGGADSRTGHQMVHAHRVPPQAEIKGPAQQVPVDRADQGRPPTNTRTPGELR
jgi:hypothetical protein